MTNRQEQTTGRVCAAVVKMVVIKIVVIQIVFCLPLTAVAADKPKLQDVTFDDIKFEI